MICLDPPAEHVYAPAPQSFEAGITVGTLIGLMRAASLYRYWHDTGNSEAQSFDLFLKTELEGIAAHVQV